MIAKVGMENAYRITGHEPGSSYSAAKIMWVRDHQPEIFSEAYKFVHAKDFIVARLTGVFATDFSDASGTNLYDLETYDWSPAMLEAAGLDRSILPDLHELTDVVGQVLASVADEVGVAAGTPVVIGGGDGCCAAAGAGVVREGSAYNYLGSSSWIAIASKQPILRPFPANLHLGSYDARHVQSVRHHAGCWRFVPMVAGHLLSAGKRGRPSGLRSAPMN